MKKSEIIEKMAEQWLLPIMRGDTAEESFQTCTALIEGGMNAVEVAFTTPDVCSVIVRLRERYGEKIIISAGTVRTPEQAASAIQAGADVIVAPNLYRPVVETTLEYGKVSMPGCSTPTEIDDALRMGADLIKLFPCNPVGPEYVAYINAPFPEARIVPAGSVNFENMEAYFLSGAFAGVAGVTTEMALHSAVKSGRWDEISATAAKGLASLADIRLRHQRQS